MNIWSRGVTRQRSPGTHLTEDGGGLTARWNVKVEVFPLTALRLLSKYLWCFLFGWVVLDPRAGREAGDRLTEKIVGKSECVKCIPEHCQEEVEGHLGVQFGLEKGYFVFYGSMLCFIFSLPAPAPPAMNFLSHWRFLQIDLCRVEAVGLWEDEDEEHIAWQANSIWEGPGRDDLAFPGV